MTAASLLGRRLADLRRQRDLAAGREAGPRSSPGRARASESSSSASSPDELARRAALLAERLAEAIGGQVVHGPSGRYVRVEHTAEGLPLDRRRLAALPGAPSPDLPLVCLDTESTGLATAAGTMAFLIGLGTWDGSRFQQTQLLLADHADEPALLDALGAAIPAEACLVTYNGRGFDWPLLVARYRLAGRPPPAHADHLDLLPFVRRVYRHRLSDARLKTVEAELLAAARDRDIEGADIPHRYLAFLHRGSAAPLVDVVRHNREDVRSLARLLSHAERGLGDRDGRRSSPAGDLAGLARAYRRLGHQAEALACLEEALEAGPARERPVSWRTILTVRADGFGPSTFEREPLLVERARLLRRIGRHDDALEAWQDLARGGGPFAGVAWVEVSKLLEHRRRDPAGALDACLRAWRIADRSRWVGRPLRGMETDLARRRRRLVGRLARISAGASAGA